MLVNGNVIAVTSELSETLSGLPCHTRFVLGVAALNTAGHVSPTLRVPEQTAHCGTHAGRALDVTHNKTLWKMVRSKERHVKPKVTHRRLVRDATQIH